MTAVVVGSLLHHQLHDSRLRAGKPSRQRCTAAGARAIGVQELSWLQLQGREPVLPVAWADCTAASQTQAELWCGLERRLSTRPAGARTRDSLLHGSWWHLLDQVAPESAPHFALGLLPGEGLCSVSWCWRWGAVHGEVRPARLSRAHLY